MNLTDWFPASVKPVRKGVYQRMYTCGQSKHSQYCYWDGEFWYMGANNACAAEHVFWWKDVAPNQFLSWRGVLK